MARANQGRWLFLWLAAAGCICIHPLPATAEEDCPPYLGPEVPILSHADSLALLIDVPARLTHAQRQLDECRALSRSGRFLDAQCSVERLMASLHELRQQVSMSYAENQKLIDLVRMAGGVRLNCVRQHLSVRPSFHPSDPDADESGVTVVAGLTSPAEAMLGQSQSRHTTLASCGGRASRRCCWVRSTGTPASSIMNARRSGG